MKRIRDEEKEEEKGTVGVTRRGGKVKLREIKFTESKLVRNPSTLTKLGIPRLKTVPEGFQALGREIRNSTGNCQLRRKQLQRESQAEKFQALIFPG